MLFFGHKNSPVFALVQSGVWELYKWRVIGLASLIGVMTGLSIALIRLTLAQKRSLAQLTYQRDITERERAQAALRESEGRFRLVANTAPVLIWMSGPDKLCTYFNQPCTS
jgi:PAS domain-containing protein